MLGLFFSWKTILLYIYTCFFFIIPLSHFSLSSNFIRRFGPKWKIRFLTSFKEAMRISKSPLQLNDCWVKWFLLIQKLYFYTFPLVFFYHCSILISLYFTFFVIALSSSLYNYISLISIRSSPKWIILIIIITKAFFKEATINLLYNCAIVGPSNFCLFKKIIFCTLIVVLSSFVILSLLLLII